MYLTSQVVQNFNFYNLDSSGMTGDDLLGNLTDTAMLSTLGMADERLNNLHGMFRSKGMAPIHRPHDEDKVGSVKSNAQEGWICDSV